MPSVTLWINLENVVLTGTSQVERNKHCRNSPTEGIKSKAGLPESGWDGWGEISVGYDQNILHTGLKLIK